MTAKLTPAQKAFLQDCASSPHGEDAIDSYPPVIKMLARGFIEPGRFSSNWRITDAGRAALAEST